MNYKELNNKIKKAIDDKQVKIESSSCFGLQEQTFRFFDAYNLGLKNAWEVVENILYWAEDEEQPDKSLKVYPLNNDIYRSLVVAPSERLARRRFKEYFGTEAHDKWDEHYECGYVLITADAENYE